MTLYEWFSRNTKQKDITSQSIARFLVRIITKGPFIDSQGIQNACECYFKEKNISDSSLTGAAYYKGVLISFQNAEDFLDDSVTVRFTENEKKDAQDIVIINLTKVEQIAKICRHYQASPKHRKRGELGKKGTEMDLSDEEGQLALNEGITHGRQIYSYFKGKFYEFQSDNAGTFHGYPISEEKVPYKVIKELNL